jgi:hypothetical protein
MFLLHANPCELNRFASPPLWLLRGKKGRGNGNKTSGRTSPQRVKTSAASRCRFIALLTNDDTGEPVATGLNHLSTAIDREIAATRSAGHFPFKIIPVIR